MSRPLRIEYPGAFYHVTSRGNEKKNIFKSESDRTAFISYLATAVERYGAVIHAYCLINNHYHLLIETPDGNLSQIMRHINGAYTNHYNRKRNRSGHSISDTIASLIPDDPPLAKKISIHLSRKLTGGKLKEIGKFYDMTDTAVTQTCKRLLLKVASHKGLVRVLAKAEKQVRMADGKR